MLAHLLKKAFYLEEMERYPNKPFPKKKDVSQHSFEVFVIGITLAEWEKRKFGNKINWEKLSKSLGFHDLAESITGDILPYLKNIDRELFDQVERELVEARLIPDLPESWRQEYTEYILNPKDDSLEGKIVAAADKLAVVEELTKMLNYLNPEKEIYKKVTNIIEESLESLIKIDLKSCKYFLKYPLSDWDIEDLYSSDFRDYIDSLDFTKKHFENELSISNYYLRGDIVKLESTTGVVLEKTHKDSKTIKVNLKNTGEGSYKTADIPTSLINEKCQ